MYCYIIYLIMKQHTYVITVDGKLSGFYDNLGLAVYTILVSNLRERRNISLNDVQFHHYTTNSLQPLSTLVIDPVRQDLWDVVTGFVVKIDTLDYHQEISNILQNKGYHFNAKPLPQLIPITSKPQTEILPIQMSKGRTPIEQPKKETSKQTLITEKTNNPLGGIDSIKQLEEKVNKLSLLNKVNDEELKLKQQIFEEKQKEYASKMEKLDDMKRVSKKQKEKEEEKRNIYDADRKVYIRIKQQIVSGETKIDKIPYFFLHKYNILKEMDNEGKLFQDDKEKEYQDYNRKLNKLKFNEYVNDKQIYYKIKQSIKERKITEKDIDVTFRQRYEVFSVLDEENLLKEKETPEKEFTTYMDTLKSFAEMSKKAMYEPHNVNYVKDAIRPVIDVARTETKEEKKEGNESEGSDSEEESSEDESSDDEDDTPTVKLVQKKEVKSEVIPVQKTEMKKNEVTSVQKKEIKPIQKKEENNDIATRELINSIVTKPPREFLEKQKINVPDKITSSLTQNNEDSEFESMKEMLFH
jgi:hypothetical protein